MGSDKTYKTTAKHFAIFKAQVQKELERFGIKNFSVDIAHEQIDGPETFANITWEQQNRWAKIMLNTEWNEEVTEEQVRLSAFHEVLELLLSPMFYLALHSDEFANSQRYSMATREQHGIIRTLENVFGYTK